MREGGGEAKKSHAKAHGAGGGAWRGRSGCLLPHPSAQQQPWHLPASPCPQVRASAAGRGQPPRLPPRPPAACLHAAQQTPGAAGAPAPARGERTQKREPPSGLHLETRGACLGQHAGRRAAGAAWFARQIMEREKSALGTDGFLSFETPRDHQLCDFPSPIV
ncbi:MAG: hypothetical protein ACPIOQ_12520 [Promethearchaeia archaeon]